MPPEDLQNLLNNDDDKDWIACIPNNIYDDIGLNIMNFDSTNEPQIYRNPDCMPGYTIYIGS